MRRDLALARAVGARMRDLRLAKSLSLVQLHERGAPTPSQMSCIERGQVDMKVETVRDVALALGMRPFQMLADDERLATLDLGEARRILLVVPNVPRTVEPSPTTARPKPYHWKHKQRAAKGGR